MSPLRYGGREPAEGKYARPFLLYFELTLLKTFHSKFYFILRKSVIYFKNTGGNEMTNQEVKKFEKKAKSVLKAVKSSKSEARKLLVGTGMYTPKGNLKKAFK